MPWNAEEFASRHNHKLSGKAARGASEAANKALASGKSEGSAVRIGNYVGNKVGGFEGGGPVGMGISPAAGTSATLPPPPGHRTPARRFYGKR